MGSEFSLELPPGWYLWDPDTVTRAETTRRAVEAHIGGDPELAPFVDRVVEIVIGFGREAEQRGAVAAATLWQRCEGAPVAANLMAFCGERSVDEDAGEIASRLLRPSPDDLRPRQVTEVELPAGRAARLGLLTTTVGEPGEPEVLMEAVQYWVPVPDQPEVLLLSCSTPCLDAADELTAAFDDIAASLRFDDGTRR